jgi:hypothetical protein
MYHRYPNRYHAASHRDYIVYTAYQCCGSALFGCRSWIRLSIVLPIQIRIPPQALRMLGDQNICFDFYSKQCQSALFSFCEYQRYDTFQYFRQYIIFNFFERVLFNSRLVAMDTDTDPAPDRQALDAVYQSYPYEIKLMCRP